MIPAQSPINNNFRTASNLHNNNINNNNNLNGVILNTQPPITSTSVYFDTNSNSSVGGTTRNGVICASTYTSVPASSTMLGESQIQVDTFFYKYLFIMLYNKIFNTF